VNGLIWGLVGFAAGAAAVFLLLRRRPALEPVRAADTPQENAPALSVVEGEGDALPDRPIAAAPPAPHLLTLIVQALREPLRELKRAQAPEEAIAKLERVAWQARMLVARPRAMRALPTSPLSLLQEAAEQVPLLRDGRVGASWSVLNRQPAHVDPERMRAVFRELLATGSAEAGERGRMGIRILPGSEPGYPVQIEIEIGRRGTEVEPLALLVARHIVETQDGRLDVDGAVTRIHLRSAPAAEPVASVA
jgi:hypothetical protein